MAKREMSSTLKNLKFMQRAAPREERILEEEIPESSGSVFTPAARRRCIVIVEGDPHPGALRGRRSFQNFNPSIDKLNEEGAIIHPSPTSIRPTENGNTSNKPAESTFQEKNSDADYKRKQAAAETAKCEPNKLQKTEDINEKSPRHHPNSAKKKQKREKLNWNVLRPRKDQKENT